MKRTLAAPRLTSRRGFTLPELLVVIAIIAILVSLSAAAYFRFMGDSPARTTRSVTMPVVDRMLRHQWKVVLDQARKEASAGIYPASEKGKLDALSGGNALRAKVIWVKLRLKQAFPQSISEVLSPGQYDLAPLASYRNYLTTAGASAGQPYDSAACLLMALQLGPSGTGANADDLKGITASFTTSNNRSIQALVDGWGQPVTFCRWPTDSKRLNPNGAAAGLNDLEDPQGLLTDASWNSGNFQGTLHKLAARSASGPMTYRLEPTVASAGPDKELGLNPSTLQETDAAKAADNLYSIDYK